MENVVGDVVVAAGCIAYSGPFTPAFRQALQQEWAALLKGASVPHTAGTNLIGTLQVSATQEGCNHTPTFWAVLILHTTQLVLVSHEIACRNVSAVPALDMTCFACVFGLPCLLTLSKFCAAMRYLVLQAAFRVIVTAKSSMLASWLKVVAERQLRLQSGAHGFRSFALLIC